MSDVVKFFLLGLGSAAVYTLLASGVIVIYRGSGIVNFGQGSFALVGGYTYYEVHKHASAGAAVAAATLAGAACGLFAELAIMWPMRRSSPLARIVATLAIVAVITQTATVRYGSDPRQVTGFLPTNSVRVTGSTVLPADRLWLFGIGVVITAVLWIGYHSSRFGIATSAVAENSDGASALGWSPRTIAAINWSIGGALAGLAGALFVPVSGLSQTVLSLAIVPALSAALVGGFSSFPLTLLGGLIIGVLESETTRWVSTPGWGVAVPFAVIVGILVFRGKALPIRSFQSDRLPRVGTGRLRGGWAAAALIAAGASAFGFSGDWAQAVAVSAIAGLLCLSLVVVTGYAGQISLAQFAFAGIGALLASKFASSFGVPFPWSWIIGVLLTIPVGLAVALPAIRARGVNLAVVTLGCAVVIDGAVLSNPDWTGGIGGIVVKPPRLFGWSLDMTTHPARYAALCLVLLAAAMLMVSNIRRGRAGRQLLAVRENERAAASVGVNVVSAKMYAFGVGAAMAALAGVMAAFENTYVGFGQYSPLQDINYLMLSVIGGIGFLFGAVVAGAVGISGVVETVLGHWLTLTNTWLLILGLFLLVQVMFTPDGIVFLQNEQARAVKRAFDARRSRRADAAGQPGQAFDPAPAAVVEPVAVAAKALELRGVTVDFGGTRALDDLTLLVRPGEVVGLIGPNGAGKTTLIDVATGFVRPTAGQVSLGGQPIDRVGVADRVRLGLTRSWQSLELFDVMTVEENLRTAAEPRGMLAQLANLFWTRRRPLPAAAQAVVAEFNLGSSLSAYPGSLPYAIRRLVGIGRAVATGPSVLLLDEPAAGLDESSTEELTRLIRRLATEWGMGILLVEHDVAMVMRTCDRIVAIEFGREIVTGLPDEVRTHPRVIEAYLGNDLPAGDGLRPEPAQAPMTTGPLQPVESAVTTTGQSR